MTTTAPSTARHALAPAELPVLFSALGLMFLHTVDEAFGHPEPGGTTNAITVVVVAAVLAVVYRRLPRVWRAILLLVLGLDAAVQGVLGHVSHIVVGDAVALDYTGVLFAAGGVMLLWLAVNVFRAIRR